MKRETLVDLRAHRDELSKQLHVSQEVMRALAHGDAPDAEDQCTMPDGTIYRFRVFGANRSHGGAVLISFAMIGYQRNVRETLDTQYFEDAATQAKHTGTAMPDAWAYREAFDRLARKVQKLQLPSFTPNSNPAGYSHAK